jgi:hypothetical protein
MNQVNATVDFFPRLMASLTADEALNKAIKEGNWKMVDELGTMLFRKVVKECEQVGTGKKTIKVSSVPLSSTEKAKQAFNSSQKNDGFNKAYSQESEELELTFPDPD